MEQQEKKREMRCIIDPYSKALDKETSVFIYIPNELIEDRKNNLIGGVIKVIQDMCKKQCYMYKGPQD